MKPGHLGLSDKDINAYSLIYLTERILNIILELSKIHQYRTPKDKMTIIINFITVVIKSAGEKESDNDYIPFIVYYLIKAEPMLLKSTLRFIKVFRNNKRFESTEERYYNLFALAVNFIENITYTQFRTTAEEFEAKYGLHEKLCGFRLEEQLAMWQHGSIAIEKEKVKKEEEQKRIIKEVQQLLSKTKKYVLKDFGKLTVTQLKEIAEVQAQLMEKLKEIT